MNYTVNPFQQLYFADDTKPESFVKLFSSKPLLSAINPVFQDANVVLSGPQGCGKTMILNLLKPETRIAYATVGEDFPVDPSMRRFISAGVNLTRSAITEVVQVTLGRGEEADERELPLYFADFFNFWVVDDLLKTIQTVGENPAVFDSLVDLAKLPQFVDNLREQDCWFGSLSGAANFDELRSIISKRIGVYRMWVGGNLTEKDAPSEIRQSKTSLGEPIARTAECLRQSGVIEEGVPVLIRVDQIEELHRAFTKRSRAILLGFRRILNRAFANRDSRVAYRAGTRRYGWDRPEFLNVWGSDARLEARRDYLRIDMDMDLFALGERKNSVFDAFAKDAFQKRVGFYYGKENQKVPEGLAETAFGKSPNAEQRLRELSIEASDEKIDRALGLDPTRDRGEWSDEWRRFLRALFRTGHHGMLDAVLAAAWGRQTGGGGKSRQHREDPPPESAPWRTREWWRKERLDQAVLQLTTRCQQRFMWWGYKDIVSLSGGNITVFLHICHRVWDGFLKSQASIPKERQIDLLSGAEIPYKTQAEGILFASNEWYKKLPEEPSGDMRQRFVEEFGKWLNREMTGDLSMSYPGGNGISIAGSEYSSVDKATVQLLEFLKDAIGYGVLFEFPHASKTKAEVERHKFHLNPILCPRYQLPEARTKEPYYRRMTTLFDLAEKAEVILAEYTAPRRPIEVETDKSQQLDLFGDIGA